jgi:hypothetical protein
VLPLPRRVPGSISRSPAEGVLTGALSRGCGSSSPPPRPFEGPDHATASGTKKTAFSPLKGGDLLANNSRTLPQQHTTHDTYLRTHPTRTLPPSLSLSTNNRDAGKYVKSLVFGGLDGIITTFAVVAASVGGSLNTDVILLMGFANLVADGRAGAALPLRSVHAGSNPAPSLSLLFV